MGNNRRFLPADVNKFKKRAEAEAAAAAAAAVATDAADAGEAAVADESEENGAAQANRRASAAADDWVLINADDIAEEEATLEGVEL